MVYSKTQIDNAGKAITKQSINKVDSNYIKIIESWRAYHAYPMNLLATKLKKLLNNRTDTIIAQRLKRLDTIINKLSCYPNIRLSRMQGLGGCVLQLISHNYHILYKTRIHYLLLLPYQLIFKFSILNLQIAKLF